MRILQVCNKPPYPPHDGGSLAMFNLARSLNRLGHEITVLTMYTPKHRLTDEKKQEFTKLMNVHAVYVDTTPHWPTLLCNLIFSGKPYNVLRFLSKSFETELTRLLLAENFDVVQLEGLYLTQYITVIQQYSTALVVLRAHNVEHEIWERILIAEKNLFRKSYFKILAKRIKRFEYQNINRYDLLVPITKRDLEQFNDMGNVRPALVCSAGVDVDSDSAATGNTRVIGVSTTAGNFSLFFLGSLDWIPNQEGLLWFLSSVFPLLHRQYPELELHVAGRNAPANLVKKIAVPGVIFYGEIADSREFMMANTIMIAPCFSGSGMRVKLIEAMAIGKPVITTPIGAEGLTVEHNENIIIADNAGDFFQHLERLMKYPDLCLKIGQNAQKFVFEKFNNLDIASTLAGFYIAHLK
jgi:glycosyltransferase involved in cell wall biosynthesis